MERKRIRAARFAGVVAMMVFAVAGVYAQSATFKAPAPVLVTSFGQSQDANFVDLLGKRLKLDHSYEMLIYAKSVDWSKYKTLIFVIGGSGKGLGSAGLDIPSEVKRCKELIDEAKKHGCKLIAMHIGGEDRRHANSTPFLDFCKEADYMIVKEDGNKDGFFTQASKDSGVPMRIVKTTMEIQGILKEVFGL